MHLFWSTGKYITYVYLHLPHPLTYRCRSRDSDFCSRLFITDHKPLPHVVVLPYGRQVNIIDHEVKGQDIAAEAQSIANILDSMLLEYPKVSVGEAGYIGLGPSLTTVQSLNYLMEKDNNSVFGYFCQQG